jgi:hypothetical protein
VESESPPPGLELVPRFVESAARGCAKGRVDMTSAAMAASVTLVGLGTARHEQAGLLGASAFDRLHGVAIEQQQHKQIVTLVLTTLKVVPLDCLAWCLEQVRLEVKGSEEWAEAMRGVVSRVDDSSRRAVLASWMRLVLGGGLL